MGLRPPRGGERENHFRPAQAGLHPAPDRRDLHRQPPDFHRHPLDDPAPLPRHRHQLRLTDNAGNIVSDGIRTFEYDQSNRLIRVEIGGATVAEYAYDAYNRRVKKVVDGETTYFHYDADGLLICETDANGNALRDYVYLNGEPAAMRVAGDWFWFLNDHLGTPRIMVDASGAVVWKAAYLPFGRAIVAQAEVENNLRFPGQYFDEKTGLHYNWHRYSFPGFVSQKTRKVRHKFRGGHFPPANPPSPTPPFSPTSPPAAPKRTKPASRIRWAQFFCAHRLEGANVPMNPKLAQLWWQNIVDQCTPNLHGHGQPGQAEQIGILERLERILESTEMFYGGSVKSSAPLAVILSTELVFQNP